MSHSVTIYTQRTASLCWEACGRMMWDWRHKGLSGYEQRAGRFLSIPTGLSEADMEVFYHGLGMRSLPNPRGANLQQALGWSPVVVTVIEQQFGHALLAVGHKMGKYELVNPCATQSINFETDANTCEGGIGRISAAKLDRSLGRYIWYW